MRRFIIALTRGGPNGIPRPIEIHAHDPVRYCGDMLAWVHQSIATENEFFRVLFDGDTEFIPAAPSSDQSTTDGPSEATSRDEATPPQCTSMVGNAFEGVARPLQVRVEQTLGSQHGIVVAYKLFHLLAFYDHTIAKLMPSSAVAHVLHKCREGSNRAFHQQFQLLTHQVATSQPEYSASLAATHAVMEASQRLSQLLEILQSSMLPEEEKEADLSPLFELLLSALASMGDRCTENMSEFDGAVFRLNNHASIQIPLSRFPEASKWYQLLSDNMDRWIQKLSELTSRSLLDRYHLTSVLDQIQHDAEQAAASLDGRTIVQALTDFFQGITTENFPHFESVAQPLQREKARQLTAPQLADAYQQIYRSLETHLQAGKVQHVHSPRELRTLLELE